MPRDRPPSTSWLPVSGLFVLALVWACDRAPARDVTLTSASARGSGNDNRPDQLPPASHTVDSDGFVDNAGRTNTERNRTEASGMRATETGSQVPTGIARGGASGLPLPFGPGEVRREPSRETPANRWALGTPQPGGASARVVAQKMARAYCDREWSCGRISVADAWASKARCMERIDSRFYEDLGAAGCPDAFDPNVVPACLSSIRERACDVKIENLASVSQCTPNTLCLPR